MKNFILLLFFPLVTISSLHTSDPLPTGKLVDIGGYKLHIDARGKGSPAVIMIAGSQAFSMDWELVAPEISKITLTVTYDRPSLAWSDPGPQPRSLEQDVYELHTLLERSGIKPPYVLVGHSLGGIIARKFEKKYPGEVKGLVLVDATSEDAVLFINGKIQRLRLLSQNKPIPPLKTKVDTFTKVPSMKDAEDFWKMVGEPKIYPPFDKLPKKYQEARLWAMRQAKALIADNAETWAEEFSALYADSLYTMGNKPLYVLSGAKDNFSGRQDSVMQKIGLEKLMQREKMSKLSTNSKHIITTRSGHEIHLDEPELVINAIKVVINSVRTGNALNK